MTFDRENREVKLSRRLASVQGSQAEGAGAGQLHGLSLLQQGAGNRATAQWVARQTFSTTDNGLLVQREDLADDPYPATGDGEQPALLTVSDEGLDFLIRHEGKVSKLYNDSEGHATIGVGHLVHRGPIDGSEPDNFKRGLSPDEIMDLLRVDIGRFEAAVTAGITSRLNQYQYDALVSFCFNIGTGGFQGSGALKKLNAKKYSEVPAEMMKWIKPAAITGRRSDEAKLFRTGQY